MGEQNQSKQPDISIPDNVGNIKLGVSRGEFEEHIKDYTFQKSILNWTFYFLVTILIVCVISFITFIIDAWKFHTDTTKEYQKTVQEIKQENTILKINELNSKIEQLENKAEVPNKAIYKIK